MKHSTKSSGENSEENHTKVTRANQIVIRSLFIEVLAVYIETENRADGDDLRGESGCACHEGYQKDCCCAAFTGDGDCRIWEDEAISDFRRCHSLICGVSGSFNISEVDRVLTLGNVGNVGLFSSPRATELITVPRPHGMAK